MSGLDRVRRILPRLPAASLLTALALAAASLACGDDEADPIGPGPVTELEILGAPGNSLTLAAGTSQEVEVGGLDADGNDNEDAEIGATSSNPAIVTVSGGVSASRIRLAHTGFDVTGVAAGSATITFEEVNTGVTAALAVTVTP
jgi:hypothetical protein